MRSFYSRKNKTGKTNLGVINMSLKKTDGYQSVFLLCKKGYVL